MSKQLDLNLYLWMSVITSLFVWFPETVTLCVAVCDGQSPRANGLVPR